MLLAADGKETHVQAEAHRSQDLLNSRQNLSGWTLIAVASRTFERLLAGDGASDDGEGCSGLESVPIRHCSCKLATQCVFPRFDFLFHLQRQYPSIATTAHVTRTSFLADVQLVRKCFSNGTEVLPGGRHLRVLSVERSTANATETLVLVHFDVAPTVYIRTGV